MPKGQQKVNKRSTTILLFGVQKEEKHGKHPRNQAKRKGCFF
jgi:hypothetical protein